MKIGGFQKVSLVEYPGKVSAVVFTAGCNLRCPFCYVPQLVLPESVSALVGLPEELIFSFLERNRGLVDAFVVTGGEPTIYDDLPQLLERAKFLGLSTGLATNGMRPSMLEELIGKGLLDYVAMDVKAALTPERYSRAVGVELGPEELGDIERSIDLILRSGIDHEFRTTLVRELHTADEIIEIARRLSGAKRYCLQGLRIPGELVGRVKLTPFPSEELGRVLRGAGRFVPVRYRK